MSELRTNIVTKLTPSAVEGVLSQLPDRGLRLTDRKDKPGGFHYYLRAGRGTVVVGVVDCGAAAEMQNAIADVLSPECEQAIGEIVDELLTYACVVGFVFFESAVRPHARQAAAYLREVAAAIDGKIFDAEHGILLNSDDIEADEFYSMVSGRITLTGCLAPVTACGLGCITIPVLVPMELVKRVLARRHNDVRKR